MIRSRLRSPTSKLITTVSCPRIASRMQNWRWSLSCPHRLCRRSPPQFSSSVCLPIDRKGAWRCAAAATPAPNGCTWVRSAFQECSISILSPSSRTCAGFPTHVAATRFVGRAVGAGDRNSSRCPWPTARYALLGVAAGAGNGATTQRAVDTTSARHQLRAEGPPGRARRDRLPAHAAGPDARAGHDPCRGGQAFAAGPAGSACGRGARRRGRVPGRVAEQIRDGRGGRRRRPVPRGGAVSAAAGVAGRFGFGLRRLPLPPRAPWACLSSRPVAPTTAPHGVPAQQVDQGRVSSSSAAAVGGQGRHVDQHRCVGEQVLPHWRRGQPGRPRSRRCGRSRRTPGSWRLMSRGEVVVRFIGCGSGWGVGGSGRHAPPVGPA